MRCTAVLFELMCWPTVARVTPGWCCYASFALPGKFLQSKEIRIHTGRAEGPRAFWCGGRGVRVFEVSVSGCLSVSEREWVSGCLK